MSESQPIETKTLNPIVVYYEDGTAEHLRVPGMGAAKDLAQIIPKLIEIAVAEPNIFALLYEDAPINDESIYTVNGPGGQIQFNQSQVKRMVESYLDAASSLLKTVSGRKLEWRKMLFAPMQIVTLFFTNRLFEYIDEQAAMIIEKEVKEDEKKDKEQDPTEKPSNELESWCYSFSSLLRLAKTPRGARELMDLTRGEIAGIIKFWNIAEKQIYSGMESEEEKAKKERIKALKQAQEKQKSKEYQDLREEYAKLRKTMFGFDFPPPPQGDKL